MASPMDRFACFGKRQNAQGRLPGMGWIRSTRESILQRVTDMSTIRLRRRRGAQLVQGRWTVLIDGVAVGRVTWGQVEECQVEPGRHIVRINEWSGAHSNEFTVDCAAGSTSHLVSRTLRFSDQSAWSLLGAQFAQQLIRVELDGERPASRSGRRPNRSQSRAGSEPGPAHTRRVELRETHRSEEPLGEEGRQIDNGSAGTVVRSLKVSRRWSKTYRVGGETTRTVAASADLKLTIASAQARVERGTRSADLRRARLRVLRWRQSARAGGVVWCLT